MKPSQIIDELLQGNDWVRELIGEASVHRPRRGKIWVASFTGAEGQQWKSTGTTDQALARIRAQEFETAARARRAEADPAAERLWRSLRQVARRHDVGLTQREIGLLLGLSQRAIRAIEKRALRKLARHPGLREVWRQFRAGELTEQAHPLAAPEIQALWGLTRSRAERAALQKALAPVATQPNHSGPEKKLPPDRGITVGGRNFRNEPKGVPANPATAP